MNLEKILFFDIETVSRNEDLKVDSEEYNLFEWTYRNRDTDEVLPQEEILALYKRKAALRPEFNKIVCISVGYVRESTFYYKSITGTQKEIIIDFYKLLSKGLFTQVCAHNGKFDLPVIRIKALEEGIINLLPEKFSDVGKKPWDMDKVLIDTMTMIKGINYNNISLAACCMLTGVESSKEGIDGSMVTEVYYKEGVNRVAKYCNKDVVALVKVYLALIGQPNAIEKFIDREETKIEDTREINIFDHILASGEISSDMEDILVKETLDKGLNPSTVYQLVDSAMSKTKEYTVTPRSQLQSLKEKLGLQKDYSSIQEVVDKGNITKATAETIIKRCSKETEEVKKQTVNLVESFLIEENKIHQKTAIACMELLKNKLL